MRKILAATSIFWVIGATGCSAPQKVMLTAAPGQQAIVRDGVPVLVSNKKHLVMLRPNSRLLKGNARPAFTLIVRNQGRTSETLQEASIHARQTVEGKLMGVRVFRYDELISGGGDPTERLPQSALA